MSQTTYGRCTMTMALGLLLGATVLLTGCGSGSGSTGSASDTITIRNFMFSPMSLTVSPGAKITVTNQDSAAHTVTAGTNKAFDTGVVGPGKTVTFTAPGKAGSYSYICDIHQYMTGTLVVR